MCGSARDPPPTHRKNLPDKTVGRAAAKIGSKKCVLTRTHQATQRNFAPESLLESHIGLHLGRKVSRVVDEILRYGIDLNPLCCQFDTHRLYVGQLRTAGGTLT